MHMSSKTGFLQYQRRMQNKKTRLIKREARIQKGFIKSHVSQTPHNSEKFLWQAIDNEITFVI